MRFLTGLLFGVLLTVGGATLMAQNERALHPRIAKAITALRDARDDMQHAPDDFGGHKADAIRATDEAIKQLNLALNYRAKQDHK